MPFRINHYASRALDTSGSLLDGERIAIKTLMLIMLIGFGYWFYDLRNFWGIVFFSVASLPIAISLIMTVLSSIVRLIRRFKNKDEKNT